MSILTREKSSCSSRSLIYTTSLSQANITSAANCSFDLLEDGTAAQVVMLTRRNLFCWSNRFQLSTQLLDLNTHFLSLLRPLLRTIPLSLLALPPHLASQPLLGAPPHSALPTPIIPILTPTHLRARGYDARPIT